MLSPEVTAAAPRALLRRGRQAWALARVEADAFADEGCATAWWFAPWGSTRAAMALLLLVADRHVAGDGGALAMVGWGSGMGWALPARAAGAVAAALTVAVLLAAWLSPAAPMLLALVLFALVSRQVPSSWRDRKARRRLRALRPDDARLVHSFARARGTGPGRGGELLEELHAIADARGWRLVLETDCPKLVAYYQGYGYVELGNEVMGPGRTRWAMCRDSEGR